MENCYIIKIQLNSTPPPLSVHKGAGEYLPIPHPTFLEHGNISLKNSSFGLDFYKKKSWGGILSDPLSLVWPASPFNIKPPPPSPKWSVPRAPQGPSSELVMWICCWYPDTLKSKPGNCEGEKLNNHNIASMLKEIFVLLDLLEQLSHYAWVWLMLLPINASDWAGFISSASIESLVCLSARRNHSVNK